MRFLKIVGVTVSIILTAVLFVAHEAHAAVVPAQNQVIIAPFGSGAVPRYVVSTSTSGTSKLEATSSPYFSSFFATTGTITNLTVGSCTGCGTGGSAYPFTPTSWGVSTSTPFGFLNANNGIIVAASSTFSGNLYLTSLTQGIHYGGSLGLTQSVATSTLTGTGLVSVTAGAYTLGSTPIVVSCATCGTGSVTSIAAGDGIAVSPSPITTTGTIYNPFAIATTSGLTQGGIAYYTNTTGKTTIGNVATSSGQCSGSVSCSAFTVVGSVSPTITSAALLTYDAWTHAVPTSSATTSTIGLGSTTPFAALSVSTTTANYTGQNLFSVAGNTNLPLFNVLGNGNVGVATATPGTLFSINGSANFTTGTSTILGNGLLAPRFNATASSTFAGVDILTGGLNLQTLASCATTKALTTDSTGHVICGTITAAATPGGATSTVQINGNGTMIGLSNFFFNGTYLGVGTTTGILPTPFPAVVTIASSTAPEIAFGDGTGLDSLWVIQAGGAGTAGSGFFLSTTTAAGTATSSPAAFSIYGNLGASINSNLTVSGSTTLRNLNLTTALPVAQGGTALRTIGGTNTLLYTSSADVITSLATANTSAYVTSSTGVPGTALGTTPSRLLRTDGTTITFAQAVLTSDVSGILPILNGGTATSTFQKGGVTYFDGTLNTLSQSATTTNFFWDESTKRLGIGTSSPWASITIDRNGGVATSSIVVTEYKRNATSTAMTIDARDSNQQILQIFTAATTITLNTQTFLPGQTLRLVVCNPHAGTAGAITWATSNPVGALLWSGGTAPTQTTTLDKCDLYSFVGTQATSTSNGGTSKIFGAGSTSF